VSPEAFRVQQDDPRCGDFGDDPGSPGMGIHQKPPAALADATEFQLVLLG
jgi:hypothetical protein